MPELPPDLSICHWATNSKLVYCFSERITPVGLPVQWRISSFQLHVSFAQLALVKSDSPSLCQPRPLPSIKALGRAGDSGLFGSAARAAFSKWRLMRQQIHDRRRAVIGFSLVIVGLLERPADRIADGPTDRDLGVARCRVAARREPCRPGC